MDKQVIEKHKRKYGEIYLVEVEGREPGDPPLEFLFRRPDRKTMAAAAKFAATDPYMATEIMVKNCLLEGDEKALEEPDVMAAVATQFEEIQKPRAARLKKL